MKIDLLILVVILSLSFAKKEIKEELVDEDDEFDVIGEEGKEETCPFEEFLNEMVGCLRNLFINGDAEAGFPSLQEIDIGDQKIDITNDTFSLKMDITNFKIYNLGNFTINKVCFRPVGFVFEYDLQFHITTSGQYTDLEANILSIIDAQGEGDMNLEMVLNPFGRAKVSITGEPEWILTILEYYGFLLVQPNFQITGIMQNEQLSGAVSKQISLLIDQFMVQYKEDISAYISPIVMEKLNEWIADPDSLLNKILNLAFEHCPTLGSFLEMLHQEAIKQGLVKNPV